MKDQPLSRSLPSWLAPPPASRASTASPSSATVPVVPHVPSVVPAGVPREFTAIAADDVPPESIADSGAPDLEAENRALRESVEALRLLLDAKERELVALSASVVTALKEARRSAEPEIVRLALAVAERVVEDVLVTDPTTVVTWVRKGLAAIEQSETLFVTVGPELGSLVPRGAFDDVAKNVVVTIAPGEAPFALRLTTAHGCIDLGAEARLAAVTEAVGVAEVA
ncbi:MAG: FliH/SctL family protein [Polyangiaceae bacterium]